MRKIKMQLTGKLFLVLGLMSILCFPNPLKSQTSSTEGINIGFKALDPTGSLITSQKVFVQAIVKYQFNNNTIYSGSDSVMVNDMGVGNFVLGQTSASTGVFANIDWANKNIYVEIYVNGSLVGTPYFWSTPYSIWSKYTSDHDMTRLNQANIYSGITVDHGDLLKVEGTINLTSNQTSTLNKDRLSMFGGGFQGNGSSNMDLRVGEKNCTYSSVSFKDLRLLTSHQAVYKGCVFENVIFQTAGIEAVFINCRFIGNIQFAQGAKLINPSFQNGGTTVNGTLQIESLEGGELDNMVFTTPIKNLKDCEIINSDITDIEKASGNKFTNSRIWVRRSFSDNDCTGSILENHPGYPLVIKGNSFSEPHIATAQIQLVKINNATNVPQHSVVIEGNNFYLNGNSASYQLHFHGNYTGNNSFALINVGNNTFKGGNQMIYHSGSGVKTLIHDNIATNLTTGQMGVVPSSTHTLYDNVLNP